MIPMLRSFVVFSSIVFLACSPTLAQDRSPASAAAQREPSGVLGATIATHGDDLRLRIDQEEGAALEDVLALFEKLLGTPISYAQSDIADKRVRVLGEVVVPRSQLRKLLDTMARTNGLRTWDASPGEPPMISVGPLHVSSRRMDSLSWPGTQVIPAGQLDQEPARISGSYVTSFTLMHMDNRSVHSAVQILLSQQGEGIRSLDGTNALLVTALSVDTLRSVRDVIRALDVPRHPEATTREAELQAMTERVALLEQRLAALEGTTASGDRR